MRQDFKIIALTVSLRSKPLNDAAACKSLLPYAKASNPSDVSAEILALFQILGW
jgi:hypothetical protein